MNQFANALHIGATGEFPSGKLNEADKGELAIAIGLDDQANRIILNFGNPVVWVGMTKEQAEGLAYLLVEKAGELN